MKDFEKHNALVTLQKEISDMVVGKSYHQEVWTVLGELDELRLKGVDTTEALKALRMLVRTVRSLGG